MARSGAQIVRAWPAEAAIDRWLHTPRQDLVAERAGAEPGTFVQVEGPFRSYERRVESSPTGLVETVRYDLRIPWFRWLFAWPVRRTLRERSPARADNPRRWWAPPDRLSAHQVNVLGLLAAASMVSAFVNTLFTQTVAFASTDFGIGDWGRGVAGSVVRLGILLGLPFAFAADRLGRRRIVVLLAWLAPLISALGALAPNFTVLVMTQTVGRPMGLALDVLIAVVAAEEMPRNSRAYAVSVMAMASGFGAGMAVGALPLADISTGSWRLIYLLALVWLIVARDLARRLPETVRFLAHARRQGDPPPRGRAAATSITVDRDKLGRDPRRRLLIQSVVAFSGNMLVAPASFLQNSFLKEERGFSASRVALFTLVTSTPAVVGLIAGGRIADFRGRRRLAAICVPLGAAGAVAAFTLAGVPMWFAALGASTVASAAYPALAVYRAELFPTGNRGRAASLILTAALLGGVVGLLIAGAMLNAGVSYGATMGSLMFGPIIVALMVLLTYPETAHRELEELNPQDVLDHGERAEPSP